MEGGSPARLVLVTAPDARVARELARGLVERRLAACVSLVNGIRSIYRWQGAVEEEEEVLLLIKTAEERLEELAGWVVEAHPYDVPECVALEPSAVEANYLAWLLDACREASAGE